MEGTQSKIKQLQEMLCIEEGVASTLLQMSSDDMNLAFENFI